jgi:hypothetical protein
MTIYANIQRRLIADWSLRFLLWCLLCVFFWLGTTDVRWTGGFAVVSWCLIWIFFTRRRGGKLIPIIDEWNVRFRKYRVNKRTFEANWGVRAKGIGSYDHQPFPMVTRVSNTGVFLELAHGLYAHRIKLAWKDVASIAVGTVSYRTQDQGLAAILLRDIEHPSLFVPWVDSFNSVVPRCTALDQSGFTSSIEQRTP